MGLKNLLITILRKRNPLQRVPQQMMRPNYDLPMWNLHISPESPVQNNEQLLGAYHVLRNGKLVRGHLPNLRTHKAEASFDQAGRPRELEIVPPEGRLALPFNIILEDDSYFLQSNALCVSRTQIGGEPEYKAA